MVRSSIICTSYLILLSGEITEHVMIVEHTSTVEIRITYGFCLDNFHRRDHLGDWYVDDRIIYNLIVKKWGMNI
jgi:hypothetical protein